MRSFPFEIVGFDLDGTLLDTSGDLAAAVNHALAHDGRAALPVERIVPIVGGGARHMLDQALAVTGGSDEALLDRLLPLLLDFYGDHIAVHTLGYPNVRETIDRLRGHGVTCAVATNKRERFAHDLLRRMDMLDRFACVIGGDMVGPGKAKPAPDLLLAMVERCGGGRAAFVGDSTYDVQAAKAAGLPVVVCSFGFSSQPVGTLGADAIIDGFGELIGVLEQVGAT